MFDFYVKCDEENNPPEVVERNELRATIYIVPYKWADDASYLIWSNPAIRELYDWTINSRGELEVVSED